MPVQYPLSTLEPTPKTTSAWRLRPSPRYAPFLSAAGLRPAQLGRTAIRRPGLPPLYYSSNNGLASGNTVEEALCHALCEVVERDTESSSSTILDLVPAVTSVLSRIGAEPAARPDAVVFHTGAGSL